MKRLVVIYILIVAANSANFPTFFKKCNRSDPNAKQCYIEAAQNGIPQLTKNIPEWNLISLEPLLVEKLHIAPGAKGVVELDQKFNDCKYHGISSVKVLNFDFDFAKKKLYIEATFPDLQMQCHYDFNGKVLVLPIVGNGPSTIDFENLVLVYEINMVEEKRGQKTYLKVEEGKLSLNPETIKFNFENLFNGDKALGDNINAALNEGHKEVYADIREGYEAAFDLILQNVLNSFFNKVSIEDAFN